MSILDTVQYEEHSMIEYIRNTDKEILTTIQHYTGKQIEQNRQRFREKRAHFVAKGLFLSGECQVHLLSYLVTFGTVKLLY